MTRKAFQGVVALVRPQKGDLFACLLVCFTKSLYFQDTHHHELHKPLKTIKRPKRSSVMSLLCGSRVVSRERPYSSQIAMFCLEPRAETGKLLSWNPT